MNPLKRSKISEQTANELELPVELIDDVASFYYKYIQKKLTNLDYININVPNLGTFCLKKNSVSRKLTKYELAIEMQYYFHQKKNQFSSYLTHKQLQHS